MHLALCTNPGQQTLAPHVMLRSVPCSASLPAMPGVALPHSIQSHAGVRLLHWQLPGASISLCVPMAPLGGTASLQASFLLAP